MENRTKVELRGITKLFLTQNSWKLAIEDVNLDVRENEFLVLLGPGECGKSVLLKILSGLMDATAGEVYIDGDLSKGINSQVGMVFQDLGVLPWLSVRDNVALPEKFRGIPKKERYNHAQKYIDLVGLHGFETYFPRQLSGGMKQRVGIARAYASGCKILLMDEPFGKLDAQTRYAMQEEILKIWNKEKKTVIFVTNNIEEAVYLGDRIILFSLSPMKVKATYDLKNLTRPRNYTERDFMEVRREINGQMDFMIG